MDDELSLKFAVQKDASGSTGFVARMGCRQAHTAVPAARLVAKWPPGRGCGGTRLSRISASATATRDVSEASYKGKRSFTLMKARGPFHRGCLRKQNCNQRREHIADAPAPASLPQIQEELSSTKRHQVGEDGDATVPPAAKNSTAEASSPVKRPPGPTAQLHRPREITSRIIEIDDPRQILASLLEHRGEAFSRYNDDLSSASQAAHRS